VRTRILLAAGCAARLANAPPLAAEGPVDRYVGKTPRVTGIDEGKTAPPIRTLRQQVDRIPATGPLAPLRMACADMPCEAYWLYGDRTGDWEAPAPR
jgi:hypothetical protein